MQEWEYFRVLYVFFGSYLLYVFVVEVAGGIQRISMVDQFFFIDGYCFKVVVGMMWKVGYGFFVVYLLVVGRVEVLFNGVAVQGCIGAQLCIIFWIVVIVVSIENEGVLCSLWKIQCLDYFDGGILCIYNYCFDVLILK